VGSCVSMGAVLLAGGTAGKRYALPHSRIMLHKPSGAAGGQSSDIQIHAREIVKTKETLTGILAEHCSQDKEVVAKKIDRDLFMSPEEALEFGLIDEILNSKN
jgi:ATP-dependent Clp protease protease subunit